MLIKLIKRLFTKKPTKPSIKERLYPDPDAPFRKNVVHVEDEFADLKKESP